MLRSSGGRGTPAPRPATVIDDPTLQPEDDTWSWTGVILTDGRVVSIAWLRGYPGAVACPPREAAA